MNGDLLAALSDYNIRLVASSTALLGASCGAVGTLMNLRKRALAADAMSHATLPGVAGAFLAWSALGGERSLGILLLGAIASALLAAWCIALLRRLPHVREDTATGITLGTLFGLGIALVAIAQDTPTGGQAGLGNFIFGKAASITSEDQRWIAAGVGLVAACCLILAKEFRLLCFDENYAASIGRRTLLLDGALMTLVAVVLVIGLQAVGAVLVLAMLVIPACAAQPWTHRFGAMMLLSALLGSLSGATGTLLSASAPRLPTGAVIVLVATALLIISITASRLRERWLQRVRV